MTRMTGPDCAVMCNFINTLTHTHTSTLSSAQERYGTVKNGKRGACEQKAATVLPNRTAAA